MSSIKDVAAYAGVSISTVSNVLNETRYVSPELTAKVLAAVNELQYEVNPLAAGMKSKRTGIIGVIAEDMCGVFYPYILRGINTIADERQYRMIVCDVNGRKNVGNMAEYEKQMFHNLVSSQVDGIIFASCGTALERHFEDLTAMVRKQKKYIPMISMERDLTEYGIDSVYFDNWGNAKKAVQHLVDCGCRKICHITGPMSLWIGSERYESYKEVLAENSLELNEERMVANGNWSYMSGYTAMSELLEKTPDLDAVFCGNDEMAIGAMRLLKERGRRIPQDVKLMGYDDVFLSTIVEPSVSTIHIKKRTAGERAAELLFDRIENPDGVREPIGIEMESSLVIRNSTVENAARPQDIMDW
ncbi:MAG: LacI family transcriptional regulator [Lachnospiraceae bacterium]|nr:LacI family transcriptional regulator [Lachnospiraceae bacterium]